MSRYLILLCSVLVILLPDGAWARDTLWKTASTTATCEAYERLQNSLRDLGYRCQSPVPRLHADLIGEEWLAPAGLSACYIGSMGQTLPIGTAYKCSLFWNRSEYRAVLCTRKYPEGQVAYEQSALSEWQASFMKAATALRSCRGGAVDFAFTERSAVPHFLWDHYEHELGLALSRGDSTLYLGTGTSKQCGTPEGEEKTEMGVLSFVISGNQNQTMGEDPLFWENHSEIRNGLRLTVGGLRALADIQRRWGPQFSLPHLPYGLSMHVGYVRMSAEPSMGSDNFGMVAAFRDINFLSIFDDALFDVELDLGFEEFFFDLEEYYKRVAPFHPVMRSVACRFSGGEYYKPGEETFREGRVFYGINVTGCRGGRVFLMALPTLNGNGLSPEVLFVLFGQYCVDIRTVTHSIAQVFSKRLVEDVLWELDEE